jgi:hypothetical protein
MITLFVPRGRLIASTASLPVRYQYAQSRVLPQLIQIGRVSVGHHTEDAEHFMILQVAHVQSMSSESDLAPRRLEDNPIYSETPSPNKGLSAKE